MLTIKLCLFSEIIILKKHIFFTLRYETRRHKQIRGIRMRKMKQNQYYVLGKLSFLL